MQESYRHPTLRLAPLPYVPKRKPPVIHPRLTSVDVRRLVDDVMGQLGLRLAQKKISAVVDVPVGLFLLADDQLLRTAVHQLTDNAVKAMPSGGELLITGVQCNGSIEIEVADSGPGLADPLTLFGGTESGKEQSGLPLVRQITEAHGGHVTAVNCAEGGTALTVCLPSRAMRAAA